jgi:hypothetical protein
MLCSCYGFATPALGNEALAATVAEAGWGARISNYLNPGGAPLLASDMMANALPGIIFLMSILWQG